MLRAFRSLALVPRGFVVDRVSSLDPLFKRLLGVPSISANWSAGAQAVNDFVSRRGDIAHRGKDARYVAINNLWNYKTLVSTAALDTDNYLAEFLRDNFPGNARPWNRRQP